MNRMKATFLGEVFTDVDGGFSFKRVQTGIFTLLFVAAVTANIFFKVHIETAIITCLTSLLGAGYTGIAMEKFTKKDDSAPSRVDIPDNA